MKHYAYSRHTSVLSRRQALQAVVAAGSASLIAGLTTVRVEAATQSIDELLRSLVQGDWKPGRITLVAPEIAEDGNTVPIGISVDSPMTETDYVEAIHVVAEKNPSPKVVTFRLTPLSGKASVQMRIRLGQTQRLTAVAKMSDGSIWIDSREVKVTIGGCGG